MTVDFETELDGEPETSSGYGRAAGQHVAGPGPR